MTNGVGFVKKPGYWRDLTMKVTKEIERATEKERQTTHHGNSLV